MNQANQEAAQTNLNFNLHNRRSTDPGNTQYKPKLEDGLLTHKETCHLLKLSSASLYRLVEGRQIPFYKFNKMLRFHPNELSVWLLGLRKAPITDWQAVASGARMASSQKATGGAQ